MSGILTSTQASGSAVTGHLCPKTDVVASKWIAIATITAVFGHTSPNEPSWRHKMLESADLARLPSDRGRKWEIPDEILSKAAAIGRGRRTDLERTYDQSVVSDPPSQKRNPTARDVVAEQVGVSSTQLSRLLYIQKSKPEYIKRIDAGEAYRRWRRSTFFFYVSLISKTFFSFRSSLLHPSLLHPLLQPFFPVPLLPPPSFLPFFVFWLVPFFVFCLLFCRT